ncbi:Y-family DNA polymerase [Candidatus Macondimonas diazotrophica]|jgi:protein ImuB|uniref:DNA polymerase Y family protein n=1 Tax=Candidatus Macondimonas diazotrophica TaxID=2305248 RepID=A0A4Z0FC22_9GAMM|nr:DNA polymerase Y family protein [Candidatus Macondimonas diazotrophica]TFZ83487.1 DNA polymerase Y family protein [Candidatus Macondimonas diazotrophica]
MSNIALAAPFSDPDIPPAAPLARQELWLCIHLPELALQGLSWPPGIAGAVIHTQGGQSVVHAANHDAAGHGVLPGMSLPAACALCPSLQVQARDHRAEMRWRRRVARHCLRFSDWVSLDRPDAVLLEVGGSLRLFGGSESLISQMRQRLAQLGVHGRIALAPAPLAAWMLARSGQETTVLEPTALRSALGSLPLSALPVAPKTLQRLSPLGVRTLRDLWRLPRDGLARRHGRPLVNVLDEALGASPALLSRYQQPPRFRRRVELGLETDGLDGLTPILASLMGELGRFLTQRAAATTRIRLRLFHPRQRVSAVTLQLSEPTQDSRYSTQLLNEKLARNPLPAPVVALELASFDLHPHHPIAPDLFQTHAEHERSWSQLLDEVRNQLGAHALNFLSLGDDHRPEQAGQAHANPGHNPLPAAPRPLWLLPEPVPTSAVHWRVIAAAERIESGWWDPQAVCRDYYQALDHEGRLLWVFRDLRRGHWSVHGVFG